MRNLREVAQKFKEKLKPLKVCAFDCDGVLTDGGVFWGGDDIGWNRTTTTRDGYGLKLLQRSGFKVGVISGGNSLALRKRFEEGLKLDFLYAGNEDKRGAYQNILDQGFSDKEILYMGDEFFDIPLLKKCGFGASVPYASYEVQEAADYITTALPGMGCVREVIDILRYARGIVPNIPDFEPNVE